MYNKSTKLYIIHYLQILPWLGDHIIHLYKLFCVKYRIGFIHHQQKGILLTCTCTNKALKY